MRPLLKRQATQDMCANKARLEYSWACGTGACSMMRVPGVPFTHRRLIAVFSPCTCSCTTLFVDVNTRLTFICSAPLALIRRTSSHEEATNAIVPRYLRPPAQGQNAQSIQTSSTNRRNTPVFAFFQDGGLCNARSCHTSAKMNG